MPWLGPPVALLMTLAGLGGVGAWLIATARLLFVGGLDRYLPPIFAKTHPKWKTPWFAMTFQAAFSAIFIVAATRGDTVKSAYLKLVNATLIVYFLPYLYMFATAIRLRAEIARQPGAIPVPGGRAGSLVWNGLGFLTTFVAIVLALIPPAERPTNRASSSRSSSGPSASSPPASCSTRWPAGGAPRRRIAPSGERTDSRQTILLVGEDGDARRSIERVLTADGYEVLPAESCRGALDRLRSARPAAVVTEGRLPDGNALDLLSRIKDEGASVSFIVLAETIDLNIATQALQDGADQFLIRPVNRLALCSSCSGRLRIASIAVGSASAKRCGSASRSIPSSARAPSSASCTSGRRVSKPIGPF